MHGCMHGRMHGRHGCVSHHAYWAAPTAGSFRATAGAEQTAAARLIALCSSSAQPLLAPAAPPRTWQRMLCQSSTSFCVHLSTMVEVCSGDASLARYGP